VDQPEYGTNTSYVADFIEICLSAKLSDKAKIRKLYVEKGLSAAQIASELGVAKSFVLARLHTFGIRTVNAPSDTPSHQIFAVRCLRSDIRSKTICFQEIHCAIQNFLCVLRIVLFLKMQRQHFDVLNPLS
jgi:hypothetical protein